MGIIYNIVESKKDISSQEKKTQLRQYFLSNLNNIRNITRNKNLNNYTTSMGILFQFIKKDIAVLLSNICCQKDTEYILSYQIYNLDWNKWMFKKFYELGLKDIIIWFFFHIPYYIINDDADNVNNSKNKHLLKASRHIVLEMSKYIYKEWKNIFFTEKEFIFSLNYTCLMYPITYQNANNKEILTEFNKLIKKINPWINYISPNIAKKLLLKNNPNPENKVESKVKNICFITDSFVVDSCVFRDRIGLIGQLLKEKCFNIYVASFYTKKQVTGDIAKMFINKIGSKYIELERNMDSARNRLDKLNLDVIIYPDVGMKIYPYILSFSKLAPIQINTWGHSETSGIDTIDYFVSSKIFHPYQKLKEDTVKNEFSEKLVLMNSLSTYYIPPLKLFNINTKKFKNKKELGYTNNNKLYGCLQTSYKISYEFELTLLKILKNDPNAFILLSNAIPFCKSQLNRIQKVFGIYLNRLKWYTSLDKFHYLEIVNICDVILDPFPFGGCNTSFEAFDLNIPVITCPNNYLNGNFTTGLYKKMGISECITSNHDDYYLKAIELVYKPKLKNKIIRDIVQNKHKIFLEKESVEEWKSFLLRV